MNTNITSLQTHWISIINLLGNGLDERLSIKGRVISSFYTAEPLKVRNTKWWRKREETHAFANKFLRKCFLNCLGYGRHNILHMRIASVFNGDNTSSITSWRNTRFLDLAERMLHGSNGTDRLVKNANECNSLHSLQRHKLSKQQRIPGQYGKTSSYAFSASIPPTPCQDPMHRLHYPAYFHQKHTHPRYTTNQPKTRVCSHSPKCGKPRWQHCSHGCDHRLQTRLYNHVQIWSLGCFRSTEWFQRRNSNRGVDFTSFGFHQERQWAGVRTNREA